MPMPSRTLPPNTWIHPIWALRFFSLSATLLVAAGLFLHNDTLRGMCLGGALGVLIGGSIFSSQIQDITLKALAQPSDVDSHKLT